MTDAGPRPWRWLVTIAVAAVIVSPALAREPRDGFPLSNYPMFSTNKDVTTTVDQAVGIAKDGGATPLPPSALGTDEVLQARSTLARAVRGGKAATAQLCTTIASRIASDDAHAGVDRVEIRTVSFDSLEWFVNGVRTPTKQRPHASCPVTRPSP
jgi:hypothetical protein